MFQQYQRLASWIALASLMALVALVMAPFLAPLAWAGVIAYASWPLMERLRQRCGRHDTLAAGLATVLAGLTLVIPLSWLIWLAQDETGRLYPAIRSFVAAPPELPIWLAGVPWLGDWLGHQRMALLADPQGVIVAAKTWFAGHADEVASLAGGLGRNLAKLALALMILFFFYRDGTRIVSELRHVLVRFLGPRTHAYLAAAGATTRAVVYGFLLTAIVQGTLAGLGYWVAGLGSPVVLGLITALFALIPFATPIAWGSAGAWLLLQGETGGAIGVWLWGAAVVSQIDNVLRPMFISSIGDIPFLLVLFGVLGGIIAFGLVGLFAGPVVLAVAWAVWREWAAHLCTEQASEP
ncbi:MAG: AI-2E family transporter [Gallionella sp.]|nr:AI-2E family transporter [Gallionella sp.]